MINRAGFAVLEIAMLIWFATLVGYGIQKIIVNPTKATTIQSVNDNNDVQTK